MGTSNTEFGLLLSAYSLNSTWTPLIGGILASRLGTTLTSILATGVILLGAIFIFIFKNPVNWHYHRANLPSMWWPFKKCCPDDSWTVYLWAGRQSVSCRPRNNHRSFLQVAWAGIFHGLWLNRRQSDFIHFCSDIVPSHATIWISRSLLHFNVPRVSVCSCQPCLYRLFEMVDRWCWCGIRSARHLRRSSASFGN